MKKHIYLIIICLLFGSLTIFNGYLFYSASCETVKDFWYMVHTPARCITIFEEVTYKDPEAFNKIIEEPTELKGECEEIIGAKRDLLQPDGYWVNRHYSCWKLEKTIDEFCGEKPEYCDPNRNK